ncbi:MAG: AbrB/MazE/SpoVT family DNA-binding domain-containing protein [Aquabacterium sp.]|nr:AbrB/MazE/SpoVT family DNA-binding domain-containing protein [Aquabacterium sp.]
MGEAILEIKAWGNSLGVRIPSAVARAARLGVNQSVKLTVEDGRVIITPQAPQQMTLEERLKLYDPALHGGEAMATGRQGAEKF